MNIFIRTLLYFCFLGGIATASDLQQQQSTLYPFRSTVAFQDDFISGTTASGSIGDLGWNGSGTISGIVSEAGRPGLLRIDTGAVIANAARLNLFGNDIFQGSIGQRISFVARINTNDVNTTSRMGASSLSTGNPPATGIYFEKLDADTNWFCVARTVGTQTRADTGIAIDTNFHTFSYTRNSTGVLCSIDNTAVVTITTNVPTTQFMGVFIQIITSAAASKTLDIDYIDGTLTGYTR